MDEKMVSFICHEAEMHGEIPEADMQAVGNIVMGIRENIGMDIPGMIW